MSARAPILEAALATAKAGRAVFPVDRQTKRPYTEHGFHDASTDPKVIRAWWRRWSAANLGAVVEPGQIVVDLDPGGDQEAKALDLVLPATRTVRTGREGGRHLYYSIDPALLNGVRQNDLGANINARMAGKGYVVLPPSVHGNGRTYAWETAPDAPMADCPDWVIECLKAGGWRPEGAPETDGNGRVRVGAELPEVIPAGSRNSTLFRWVAKWRECGFGGEEAAVLFWHLFQRCEQPAGNPFTEQEAERLFAATWQRYQPGATPAERHPPPEPQNGPPRVKAIDALELAGLDLPPREYLLDPFLLAKSIGEVWAGRGVGKTFFGLGCAYAVATGGDFLHFHAPRPAKVLYVEGEMAAGGPGGLQERLRQAGIASDPAYQPGFLTLVSYDLQGEGGIPSLATAEGQWAIEEHIGGVELVILDNLSCLFSLPENDADEWKGKAQPWLMDLRRRGIAVAFLHHAGKSGTPRGTSQREDALDYAIGLRHPPNYDQSQGARFVVTSEKSRAGASFKPFEAKLETSEDGGAVWTCRGAAAARKIEVLALHRDGATVSAIARELGINKGTVSKWVAAGRR